MCIAFAFQAQRTHASRDGCWLPASRGSHGCATSLTCLHATLSFFLSFTPPRRLPPPCNRALGHQAVHRDDAVQRGRRDRPHQPPCGDVGYQRAGRVRQHAAAGLWCAAGAAGRVTACASGMLLAPAPPCLTAQSGSCSCGGRAMCCCRLRATPPSLARARRHLTCGKLTARVWGMDAERPQCRCAAQHSTHPRRTAAAPPSAAALFCA